VGVLERAHSKKIWRRINISRRWNPVLERNHPSKTCGYDPEKKTENKRDTGEDEIMYRICGKKQIDGTICQGKMEIYLYARPPHENMYECSECGRRASGSKLMLEEELKEKMKLT
jgi:hypothetical protein